MPIHPNPKEKFKINPNLNYLPLPAITSQFNNNNNDCNNFAMNKIKNLGFLDVMKCHLFTIPQYTKTILNSSP